MLDHPVVNPIEAIYIAVAQTHLKLAEVELEFKKKYCEVQLQQAREWSRPCKMAAVQPEGSRFICQLGELKTYGDTPEQAADNFDNLWVFGNEGKHDDAR